MWARFHYEVLTHPKTTALANTLHIPLYSAAGLLVCLWSWAVEKSENGNISEYREKAIERVCHWDGKPGTLISALLQCGWLDGSYDDDSLRIHDWMENGGASLQQSREKAAKRQRHVRERKNNASRVTVTCDGHAAKSQSQNKSIDTEPDIERNPNRIEIKSPSVMSGDVGELHKLFKMHFPARYFKSVCVDKAKRGLFTLEALETDEAERERTKQSKQKPEPPTLYGEFH